MSLIFFKNRKNKFLLRKFWIYFKEKIRNPVILTLILFSIVFCITTIWGAFYFIDLILDGVTSLEISRNQIFFYLFIPIILFYINLVLISRIIIQRIRKKTGSFLRFKIIGFFFFSSIIPPLVFSFFFIQLIDQAIALVDNKVIIHSLQTKLGNHKKIIQKTEIPLKKDLELKLKQQNFQIKESDFVDYLLAYNDNETVTLFSKKKSLSINFIPQIDLAPLLVQENQGHYFSYFQTEGFAYLLNRVETTITTPTKKKETIINYYAAIKYIDKNLKTSIADNIELIKQVNQLDELIKPTSTLLLILFVYLYFQVYSITAIVFYYRSRSYTKPIEGLIIATQKMATGEFQQINLKPFIRKMGENEIKQLLESFDHTIRTLIENKKRLDRLSNMEAWKKVATRLAHELKNPLTPVKLSTNEIENYLSLKDLKIYADLQDKFQFIHLSVERIENLIKEFSHFSQNTTIDKKDIQVSKLFNFIKGYQETHSNIQITIQTKWEGSIFLDIKKIQQVLINLLHNSIDSVLEKKKTAPHFEPSIEIITERKEDRLLIQVLDNGIGIGDDKKEEIFKPYVTYKKSGTGLGLTICEEIVNLHKGNITLNSKNGETCFTIILPLQQSLSS